MQSFIIRLPRTALILLTWAVCALGLSQSASASPQPRVLASIKPVQMIAAAITAGVTQPELLLAPGSSPHDYSLKPSDIRQISAADVIFWIGGDLEGFLAKPLASHKSDNTSIVALMDAHDVHVAPFTSASTNKDKDDDHDGHDDHDDHDHASDHHHRDHHHGSHDPHIWLSPNNALAMAQSMAATLSRVDPANAKTYSANLKAFEDAVELVDQDNKTLLQPVQNKPFFVFHDAWGYFIRHYRLNLTDVFTLNPDQQPGARHMLELRKQLKAAGNSCVFREPQFKPGYLNTMLEGLNIRVGTLDPLGSEIQVSPTSYQQLLQQLAVEINRCLTITTTK